MKRLATLFMLSTMFAAGSLVAQQTDDFTGLATLIDFSQLVGDTEIAGRDNLPEDMRKEHGQTLIDYSTQAGTSFTAADKAVMKTSLRIRNWEVRLTSSARVVQNVVQSQIREAAVKDDASRYGGQTVMGVRVHFPLYRVPSSAMVVPPFDIPAYATLPRQQGQNGPESKPGDQFVGYGVVKNVGVIRDIQVNYLGRNYPHGLSIVLENENAQQQTIFLGYLQSDGWNTLQWRNPQYQTEVRNRELRILPLYPRSAPYIRLKGLIIHRDAATEGGDFISYFKDIKIIYDRAVLNLREDIDDEGTWGILNARESARRSFELSRLGRLQVLRALEMRKMATIEDFPPQDAAQQNPNNQ